MRGLKLLRSNLVAKRFPCVYLYNLWYMSIWQANLFGFPNKPTTNPNLTYSCPIKPRYDLPEVIAALLGTETATQTSVAV